MREDHLTNHVTSLDLSRRLAELGVKKDNHFWWVEYTDGHGEEEHWYVQDNHIGYKQYVPAYLASELAGMLPVVHQEPKGCKFDYFPIVIPHEKGGRWCGYYQAIGVEMYLFDELYADTMAECYGLMLAHLLETGAVGLQD